MPQGLPASFKPIDDDLIESGNIELYGRPEIENNGQKSTVFSSSFNIDGNEVLLPLADDGRILTEDEAINKYRKTGKHLGKFRTPQGATKYAEQLHNEYESGKYNLPKSFQPIANEPPEEKSLYQRFTEPQWTGPSRLAESINKGVDKETGTHLGNESWGQGFVKGGLQGIGDAISGMTSIGNIALTAATLGQSAGLAPIFSRVLSAPFALHGAKELLRSDASLQERAFGLFEAAGGGAGMLHVPHANAPKLSVPKVEPKLLRSAPFYDSSEGFTRTAPSDNLGPTIDITKIPGSDTYQRPSGPWDTNPDLIQKPQLKTTEDRIYDIARDKFNMGRDLPSSELTPDLLKEVNETLGNKQEFNWPEVGGRVRADEIGSHKLVPESEFVGTGGDFVLANPSPSAIARAIEDGYTPGEMTSDGMIMRYGKSVNQPTAEFLGLQQDGSPLFNIKGGPKDRSTVSLKGLEELGIEAPPIPKDAVPMRGDELRAKALALKNQEDIITNFKNKIDEIVPKNDSEVLYHGTNSKFDKLLPDSYFTASPDEAAMWANTRVKQSGGEPFIYSVPKDLVKSNAREVLPENAYRSGIEHEGIDVTNKILKTDLPESFKAIEPEIIPENEYFRTTEEKANLGEKIVDWDNKFKDRLGNESVFVRNLNGPGNDGYTSSTNARFIEDTLRMKEERRIKEADPIYKAEQKKKIDDWNKTQENLRINNKIEKELGIENVQKLSDEEYQTIFDRFKQLATEETGAIGKISQLRNRPIAQPRNATGQFIQKPEITKLLIAMKEAAPIREAQEQLYTQERGKRIDRFESVSDRGEAGAFKKLGKLSGKMPELNINRLKLEQPEVDSLFNSIVDSNKISSFEKAKAIGALGKILNGGQVPQRSELQVLGRVFGKDFYNEIIQMHGGLGGPVSGKVISDVVNLPKSIMASTDFSAPFRQGLPLAYKKQYWQAFGDMFKSARSQEYFDTLMQTIDERPLASLGRESGLVITGLDELGPREEAYLSQYIDKVPFIKGSERAYVGFLNKLRADVFDDLVSNAEKLGLNVNEIAPAIANFINNATGRGNLGKLEKSADALNALFFSPRMIASRINMMNPMYYVKLPPFVRQEALKALFTVAGSGTAVTSLLQSAGAEVNLNPYSSDFGKAKIGNTRIDPFAGFQQYVVAASKMIMNKEQSTKDNKTRVFDRGYKPNTRATVAGRFIESKLSPVAGFIWGLLKGKDFKGNNFDIPKEVESRFTPMLLQDIHDLYESDPELLSLALPAAFGMGVQTYSDRENHTMTSDIFRNIK